MGELPIATLAWGLPDDWVGWAHGDLAQAEVAADALGENELLTRAVVAATQELDAIIEAEIPGTTFAAIWVPHAGYRKPLASATLRVASAPSTGRMDVESLLQFVRDHARGPRGTRVLDVAALPSRVVAGDAVLRIVDRSPRFRREVSREWTWFILPPGTDETISCRLESSSVAHFDELADMATDIANAVEVTLEPV